MERLFSPVLNDSAATIASFHVHFFKAGSDNFRNAVVSARQLGDFSQWDCSVSAGHFDHTTRLARAEAVSLATSIGSFGAALSRSIEYF